MADEITTKRALLSDADGLCGPRCKALVNADGEICNSYGEILELDGETTIRGWGELDGPADVYRGAGPWRLIIPRA